MRSNIAVQGTLRDKASRSVPDLERWASVSISPQNSEPEDMKSYRHFLRARNMAVTVFAVLLVGGCASGPKFTGLSEVREGNAQIVLFRPSMFLDGGIDYQVNINGQQAVVLSSGTFAVVHVPPGALQLDLQAASWIQNLSFDKVSLSLPAEANNRTFVRVSPKLGTVIPAFAYVGRKRFLQAVPESDARLELIELTLTQQ